ncbi:prepilin-type N-terminal cleavage/methylation domain-containing protein [Clostridium intestinale]|uniref:type II secretion system protein n=1 Tax=Clostridium intestinale TaxID=36845 RepID=UPI0028E1CC7D|nr:prepilin-type N-terminal cleavage/methylation domain-containing protein [Clostridium intestinale]
MMMKKINKKKKGFTLIELIAVIAIIGILAAVLVPKVSKYMDEAKKTKVLAQARTVVTAVESAKAKDATPAINESTNTITDLQNATTGALKVAKEFVEASDVDKLPGGLTIEKCRQIVDNKVTFKLGSGGVLDLNSLATF